MLVTNGVGNLEKSAFLPIKNIDPMIFLPTLNAHVEMCVQLDTLLKMCNGKMSFLDVE